MNSKFGHKMIVQYIIILKSVMSQVYVLIIMVIYKVFTFFGFVLLNINCISNTFIISVRIHYIAHYNTHINANEIDNSI